MEDNPGYNELPSEEVERQNEGAGEERSEKFGESLLRAMEITKEAIEKQSISKEDFFAVMDAFEESPDEVEDSIGPNLDDVTRAFLNTVSKEGSWGEVLGMFEQKGGLSGYLLIEMMNAGMPLDLALSEKYIQLIAEMPTLDNMSPGLLSRIYEKMATSKEGEERFKDIFISNNKIDTPMARGVFGALQDGGSLSQEQKADMELYMKMGGNLLMSTLCRGYLFAPSRSDNVSISFEEENQKNEKFGQDIVGVLLKEGLLSTAEASGLFEKKFNTITGGTGYMATIEDAALNKIIASGLELSSDDDEIEYWINACREKRKNVLESFRTICKNDNEDVLDEYDFNDQREIRLLAAVLANEDIYVENLKLYSKIINRGLLDSNFFQDELVKAIAQCEERKKYEGHEDEYDSEDEENSAAVVTLALKRGLLERLNEDGLFDKYPSSQTNMIIAKVREGHFTEKDRLESISHDFDMDSYYDEDGELDDSFFKDSYDTESYMVFLDDSEKRRCCDCLLEIGKYDKLAKMGEDVWSRGNISAEVRGFLSSYDRYHLDECFLSHKKLQDEELARYFDESGPKSEFWDECVRREDYSFLGLQEEELLSSLSFDKDSRAIIRGMSKKALGGAGEVNKDNILSALTRFIYMDARDWGDATEDDLKIQEAFSEANIANKDEAMRQLRLIYEEYLKSGDGAPFPKSLAIFARFMHENDGAGPLTQIEAFLDYCDVLGDTNGDELKSGIKRTEARIKGWDNIDKANFYVTSAEILRAGPEFFQEFINVFDRLDNARDFKRFSQEIFPLYRAKLALLKNYEDHSDGIGRGYSTVNYDEVDKEKLLNDLHTLLIPFTLQDGNAEVSENRREDAMTIVKEKLFGEISELFTEKFGILPEVIPKELDKDGMRSVENMVLYLSNIKDSNADKKNIIGFFLALQLTKREDGTTAWDSFRRGEWCDPYKYLTPERAVDVEAMVGHSDDMSPITEENTRISSRERLEEFRSSLQDEVSEIRVGSVSTIDVKLQNLKGNIEELADPDLYPDPMDKSKIGLVSQYPPRMITKTATALWLREKKGIEPSFNETEAALAEDLIKLLVDAGMEVTPDNINKYLQRGFDKHGPVAKTLALIREKNVAGKIAELQDLLVPQGEIVKIFGELGEEFRPGSGVLALSADLEYLDSIVRKGEKYGAFSGDEAEQRRKLSLIREYLGQIEQRMAELDTIYGEIAKSFESIRRSSDDESASVAMIEKLKEIQKIIGGEDTVSNPVIVSTCSTNLNVIIENMRACLSCRTSGMNNDTNLTFGDGYKFYVYSQSGANERGSIADEIVYFVPTSTESGEVRMSLVMDKIYGTKNSDILMGHIGVLVKKAKALKAKYPEVPISIFVTSNGCSSCSVPIESESLMAQLEGIDGVVIERGVRTVDIPESGLGDHYIEIGDSGDERRNGTRAVDGIEIIL